MEIFADNNFNVFFLEYSTEMFNFTFQKAFKKLIY
ncbi:hypothetical protein BC670_2988 [Flavobacterium branchiophilum]|uniref:Uncharacterized protein n=1 Tax=Flavobacterium branchiophilum TaxID=55197 RepID=A0A543G7A3_9FLAO|nr:hypothetical protein BC670_2988 [Flavobacterium branchiophilum]